MSDTIITLNGWSCPQCGYKQESNATHLADENVPSGDCPNCFLQGNTVALVQTGAATDMIATVADDTTLASYQVEDTDANGNPIMIPSGQTIWQLDPNTGQSVQVDVMVPQMRSLTTDELANLKTQRDANLSEAEANAV